MNSSDALDYKLLNSQLAALLDGEPDALANSANFVALLYGALPNINWLGIYVRRESELVLGPFQGKPACVHIAIGKGVCGTAAERMETLMVDDVHQFDGHIACDVASNSELVVPLQTDGKLLGVLDIDSPLHKRFTEDDRRGIETLCRTFEKTIRSSDSNRDGFI